MKKQRREKVPEAPDPIRLAITLLQDYLDDGISADRLLESAFRTHRLRDEMARATVAETLYGVLRQLRSFAAMAGQSWPPRASAAPHLVCLYLWQVGGWTSKSLVAGGFAEAADLTARAREKAADLTPAERANVSDELWERLAAALGEQAAMTFARTSTQVPAIDLRVNTLLATREQVQRELAASGIPTELSAHSPVGLRLKLRRSVYGLPAWREGRIEVQDEASQRATLLSGAAPKQRVLDLCAGAGGKTLALAAMMQNTGSLVACDIHDGRLAQLRQRLKRAKVDNARVQKLEGLNDPWLKRQRGRFDVVLIDAPCSGTGTLRRHPEIKWRPVGFERLAETQLALLERAATLVKPGGRLVYVTCSVLPAENADRVGEFLTRHPEFRVEPVSPQNPWLQLSPEKDSSDGFFGAVLIRAADAAVSADLAEPDLTEV